MLAGEDVRFVQAERPSELGVRGRRRAELGRPGRGELREDGATLFRADRDRHGADVLFEHDAHVGLLKRNAPERGEHVGRADRGMPGERELDLRRVDAQPRGVRRIARRKDEGGLREIELARDELHLRVGQPVGVREDRERVAAEDAVGEDVNGQKAVAHGVPASWIVNHRGTSFPSRAGTGPGERRDHIMFPSLALYRARGERTHGCAHESFNGSTTRDARAPAT